MTQNDERQENRINCRFIFLQLSLTHTLTLHSCYNTTHEAHPTSLITPSNTPQPPRLPHLISTSVNCVVERDLRQHGLTSRCKVALANSYNCCLGTRNQTMGNSIDLRNHSHSLQQATNQIHVRILRKNIIVLVIYVVYNY